MVRAIQPRGGWVLMSMLMTAGCSEPEPSLDFEAYVVEAAELSCALEFDRCVRPRSTTLDACRAQREIELRARHAELESDERRYDGTCAQRVVDVARGERGGACMRGCSVYPGTVAEGEACTVQGDLSDCAQGLVCSTRGVCQPHAEILAIPRGERCRDGSGRIGECADGYACAGNNTCVSVPAIGETCLAGTSGTPSVCAPEHFCDPDLRVCAERKSEGQVCTGQEGECRDGHTCQGGTCVEVECVATPVASTCFEG